MPPPTASDPWLASRRFGIVIDAGSSGSRLQVYSWRDPRISAKEGVDGSLPKVEKGVPEGEEWYLKVEPGLSTFADNPEGVTTYLAPLLNHARELVPPSLQHETPLFLLATAGMRLLTTEQQTQVLSSTCKFLRMHSNFLIDNASAAGPCGSSVRIISGEEEGLFGWIAVNYLMDGFSSAQRERTTYGFLDMGGASTQIAFEPSAVERAKAPGTLKDVRLRLLGGQEIHHHVFVTTWLGYGTNQARERYVGAAIDEYEKSRKGQASSTEKELVPDPCLPKDLIITESPVHTGPSDAHAQKAHSLLGTGDFGQCMLSTSPLLNKHAPCPDTPCLFNGVHVPPIDFSASRFIGVSEYWYSSEDIFGLGGPYDFVQYERAAQQFCAREWSDIITEHERSRNDHHLGGDGQVEVEGQVVKTGQWGPQVEIPRLQMQCFKAAWIANVLHEGIGMPRIVDAGGNSKGDAGGQKVAEQAEQKGLGKPVFQSMDNVDDIAITWTLGKMVLEASKEVPAARGSEGPISDPMEDAPPAQASPYIPDPPARPPLLDFEAIEDHLPSSLQRGALGFSFFGLLFYAVSLFAMLSVIWRLRPLFRSMLRRVVRSRRERGFIQEEYSLEEGRPLTGALKLPQRLQRSIQHMFSSPSPRRARPAPLATTPSFLRAKGGPIQRNSPTRSQTMPAVPSVSVDGISQLVSSTSSQYSSRASSPAASSVFEDPMANSLGHLARSRNSSQISLAPGGGTTSSLRQGLARAAVQQQSGQGRSFVED